MTRRDLVAREMRARIMRRAQTHPSTCWTGKLQYVSQREASQALRAQRRTSHHDTAGLVPYQCDHCTKWHTGHGLGDP